MDEPAKMVVWYHPPSNTAYWHLAWEPVPVGYIVSDHPAHAALASAETTRAIERISGQMAADPALAN